MNVRPGEWRAMLLLQLQIFLIIAVLLITKPVGSAFFLSRFGPEALPYAYILTAIVAAIISTVYAAAVKYFSILRVNLWSLGVCIFTLLLFGLVLPLGASKDIVAVGLYLWVALFGVLAASQFWMLASMVFDIRQSKRLFGPIGAGAIAGGILGGYLANLLASVVGMRMLLFLATAMLLPCIFISLYIWRHYVQPQRTKAKREFTEELAAAQPYRIILASNHLLLLCGIIALSVITAKLVDYQFSALASARFADPDRLTAFFGFWFSTFNVIGLLIQLLFTQRIVQRIGVSGALLFLPAGLSLGAFFMFLVPGLGAATFSRLVDGSLKQSLHRAGVEMLFLPVDPQVKGKVKTYIDVLVDSAAGGIGGLLLLLLVDGFGITSFGISPVVLFFALIWLVCVLLIREEYLDAFRDQLRHLRPKDKRKGLDSRHKEVLAGFLRVLNEAELGSDGRQVLYVLERTADLRDEQFTEPIQRLLHHESPAVRARALNSLSLRQGPDLLMEVMPMLADPDIRVKNAALEYLVTHHLEDAEPLIQDQLNDPRAEIAGAALVELVQETRSNPVLRKRWKLQEHFDQRVEALQRLPEEEAVAWRRKLLVAAGRAGTPLGHEFLATELGGQDPKMVQAAILAAGESLDERWIFPLVNLLSEAPYRPYAISVLVQYDLSLVRALPTYLQEGKIQLEDLRRLPTVLEKINHQQTVVLLFALIEKYFPADLELRLEVLRALNAMRRDFPELQMPATQIFRHILAEAKTYRTAIKNLEAQAKLLPLGNEQLREARSGLYRLLLQRQDGNLDRLFRLMGLRYPPADIIPVYRGLRAAGQQEKINALEFLDVLLDQPLKRLVIPLMEYGIQAADAHHARQRETDVAQLEEIQFRNFRRILGGRDVRLKLAVIHVLGLQGDVRYRPILEKCLSAPDKRVRDFAEKALRRLRGEQLQ
ncbi:HEAT repeat domain-containing protein [Lewinella lacunae]|uniref:ADP,ATP carrier protein n=2 Tax=Neolewinella lacunae TaxID=1517758 RepID=A0A923PKT5_9BACT|nr:HEAT repeat domain-containing protein [Neolewinella lacunae]